MKIAFIFCLLVTSEIIAAQVPYVNAKRSYEESLTDAKRNGMVLSHGTELAKPNESITSTFLLNPRKTYTVLFLGPSSITSFDIEYGLNNQSPQQVSGAKKLPDGSKCIVFTVNAGEANRLKVKRKVEGIESPQFTWYIITEWKQ